MFSKKKNVDISVLVRINNLPILILDEKYNYSFKNNKTERMIMLEDMLKNLLKEQGSLNNEHQKLLKTKKLKLSEILKLSGDIGEKENSKKMGQNHELIDYINNKIIEIEKRLEEIPFEILDCNQELFSEAVKFCYNNSAKLAYRSKKLDLEIEKMMDKLKEKVDEKNLIDDEYKEKAYFLENFIGSDGIELLDDNFDGVIK